MDITNSLLDTVEYHLLEIKSLKRILKRIKNMKQALKEQHNSELERCLETAIATYRTKLNELNKILL